MNKNKIICNGKRILIMIVILYIFLLSIKLVEQSFNLFGNDLVQDLFSYTSNPFIGLFIGILATSIVQSSSVITSIVVGIVATGSMGIASAIPMIMGANIGTSVTSLIVSMGHLRNREEFVRAFEAAMIHDMFNLITVIVLLPLEISFHLLERITTSLTSLVFGSSTVTFSSPLNTILEPVAKGAVSLMGKNPYIILVCAGVLLFISLKKFVDIAKPVAQGEFSVLVKNHIFKSPIRGFTFGLLLTAFVQSSSVTTSLLIPLAAIGFLTLEEVFPYTLGANVGTTITAILASLATNSAAALTVALAHLMFNMLGIVIVYPIRAVPFWLSRKLAAQSYKSRMYPVMYVASAFYALPLLIIFLTR